MRCVYRTEQQKMQMKNDDLTWPLLQYADLEEDKTQDA